jgi:hypothetical protein
MFSTFSQLFWYRPLFLLELLVAEGLFSFRLSRRKFFWLRLVVGLGAAFALAFLIPILRYDALYVSLIFLVLFFFTVLLLKFLFAESWWNILFCAIAGYTVQHFSFAIFNLVVNVFFVEQLIPVLVANNPYSSTILTESNVSLVAIISYLQIYFSVYWISFFSFADRIKSHSDLHIKNTFFVLLSGLVLLIDVFFNMLTVFNASADSLSLLLEGLYTIITCLLALLLQFSQLQKKEVEGELDSIKCLWAERKNQYEMSKSNIDLINLKVHDLKHQIHALGEKTTIDNKELSDIEKTVKVYETNVKTGNEALDVVLSEKTLICEENHITTTMICDGKLLSFMEPADIYSLFGNALDNAIEALKAVKEDKRLISLEIKKKGNLINIHLDNYYEGSLHFKDGLPETTKADHDFHGFGSRSMKAIATKYGGTFSVEVVNQTFNLNLLFIAGEKR